jgi:hypothetical protein
MNGSDCCDAGRVRCRYRSRRPLPPHAGRPRSHFFPRGRSRGGRISLRPFCFAGLTSSPIAVLPLGPITLYPDLAIGGNRPAGGRIVEHSDPRGRRYVYREHAGDTGVAEADGLSAQNGPRRVEQRRQICESGAVCPLS